MDFGVFKFDSEISSAPVEDHAMIVGESNNDSDAAVIISHVDMNLDAETPLDTLLNDAAMTISNSSQLENTNSSRVNDDHNITDVLSDTENDMVVNAPLRDSEHMSPGPEHSVPLSNEYYLRTSRKSSDNRRLFKKRTVRPKKYGKVLGLKEVFWKSSADDKSARNKAIDHLKEKYTHFAFQQYIYM
jgi:hypothetical protein